MKRYSLTARLALCFALLSFCTLSFIGITLYHGLEKQLTARDDALFVEKIESLKKTLRNPKAIRLAHDSPDLFRQLIERSDLSLTIQLDRQSPAIIVHPQQVSLPALNALPTAKIPAVQDLHHGTTAAGLPFIAIATSVSAGLDMPDIRLTAGQVLEERVLLLKNCRDRVLMQIVAAALLFALTGFWVVRRGLLPLRQLVQQTEKITVKNLDARIDGQHVPTELAPVIDAFNAMLGRVSAGFSQISQLSADMAHDLRTPINNLLGQTEVALSQPRATAYYESLLVSNLEELQRLCKMTDSMLFLARSEKPDMVIERNTLCVATELNCVKEYFEVLAEERDLQLIAQGGGTVYADPTLLRRALANLIANAVQYADPGTTIVLKSESAPAGTQLSVQNRGPTIEKNQLNRLFDRFYRADASRRGSAESSGLGLSIVRSIMTLHQGRWEGRSENGATRFDIFFPRDGGNLMT